MSTVERIRQCLHELTPLHLEIGDDSHLHAGHAGAGGGGHFRVSIVSARFAGKRTMERHRMVYDALGSLLRGEIHALSISARTPDEISD